MGCDIHLFIEHRKTEGDRWNTFGWAQIDPGRNYEVFGRLAGVRGGESLIGPPRGIPADLAYKTRSDYEKDGSDGHTPSWCWPDEWERVITGTDDDPGVDYHATLAIMRELKTQGRIVRAVFWFDN